ncbi:WD domain, G-beta repeat [Nesidiocoris tenuis]|uniref:WD domain, G-beta repeat n=1 Tax=Nesidiocoris tenuis TaxID=355587 RepID=A0ABN7A5H0_9HEMI|nr:WD domain, G-beta repeat [Nesidiocoris tenuis]
MDSSANTLARKVITAPSLKRGKDETTPVNERVKLEKVLGLTVTNNAGLDSDSNNERVAYPAGCTVVLLDTIKGKQSHIQNSSKKTITCVGFSSDGRYLATGECGHSPSVRLWDLHELTMVAELTGHKYSVNCLAFSPTQKYVVSVGSQHDMIVNVWDWRSGIKVASNKVSTKVKAISFAENGTYFVTAGNRHVKFWYLEYHRGSKYKEPVPLMGRSAILGEQRNNDFVDVACGRGDTADSTYTITRSGLLCEFNNRRLLDKWVELRTTSANCMTLGEQRIFIGCADGIVRCFDPRTLQFITTLPRTHYLGVDVSQGLDISHMATHPNQAKYPDAIAVTYDERNAKLTCVYNDHSLYVWDVRDIKRVGKSHSNLYHSACIWGVEIFPEGSTCPVPPGSFVTCSSDDTIRVWSIDTHLKTQPDSVYQRNIYSNELVKVIYVDPEMTCLKDVELASGEKTENPTAYDGKNGVRALRISPDGKHLASGDRSGNIRVHDTTTLEEICLIEAHDAEVLCLEYNRQLNGKRLLASASRDRLVHVFDVDEDYNFLQTLDDHSSSITAVRFLNGQSNLQMVSCGADKSIIFRQLQSCPDGQIQFNRIYNAAGKTTLYDMEVDFSHKYVITACQDRNIRVYNVSAGKHTKTFKGSIGEEGSLIKVALDASGIYVATSCTDKTLCIYDFYSGECMATMSGHSELVTGLRFSQDCTRLISASGDGCVLVWSVPHDMVVTMQARLSQQAARSKKSHKLINGHTDNEEFAIPSADSFDPNANQPDYRFSVGHLPVWAKKESDSTDLIGSGGVRVLGPRGKWAHRIDHSGITIRSIYDSDSIIPFPNSPSDKKIDSDGSKEDSSVDSGAETGRSLLSNHMKESSSITARSMVSKSTTRSDTSDHNFFNKVHTDDSSLGSFKYEDIESTEHDGDVEDYSEGESSYTKRPLYIPSHDEPNREFPVTNIDSTELRKSMRKSKRPDLLMVASEISSASRSMSGSQSDDDDHATTPTSDHPLHSMSTDALDVIAYREKYLKNTFESLSGAEESILPAKKGKRSLSSQHHGNQQQMSTRNSNLIQAAKTTKNDVNALSKREELQRRIQETRRQLQSVGYRSNLKTSRSIQDLSIHGPYGTGSGGGGESRSKGSLASKSGRNFQQQGNNEIDSSTFTRRPRNRNHGGGRPVSLNLSQLSATPFGTGCKSMENSLSCSPTAENCPSEMDPGVPTPPVNLRLSSSVQHRNTANSRVKRYSCCFYVNIDDKEIDVGRESKSVDDLSELGKNCDKLFLDEQSDLSEYSSDSLEEMSEYGAKPRRCISEYQILERSSSAFGFKGASKFEKTKFHSEENILANEDENWDRHSSASFFLRKNTCRSTESILTDESEYQFLFSNRDVFHSTESILTDAGDVKEFSEDLDQIPQKQPVVRTRSLQDTTARSNGSIQPNTVSSISRPATPFECDESDEWPVKEKLADKGSKHETFFIPLGNGPIKPVIPESLLRKHQNREERKGTLNHSHHHPIVAHKPPKPKVPPALKMMSTKGSPHKFVLPISAGNKVATAGRQGKCQLKKDLLKTPLAKDPGLNSIGDIPPFNGGRVKLLSQNFERISLITSNASASPCHREELSCDSGSSTPGTSSSCANSPKRKWKPSIGNQLARRIANGQLLPDKFVAVGEESTGGIRRACSLSDLTAASGPTANRRPSQVAVKSSKTHAGARHSIPKGSQMTRSSSVGILNQSDSESEVGLGGQRSLVSLRIMRPTISSQNKMNSTASKSRMEARRRGLSGAYSTMALNQSANTEDSSSEENQAPPPTKPTPPPRPKSVNLDRPGGARRTGLGRSGSDREINRIAGSSKLQRSASGHLKQSTSSAATPLEPSPFDFEVPVKDTDAVAAPLPQDLVETTAEQLQKAADQIIKLHERLATIDPAQREALLSVIGETQKKLGLLSSKPT